MLHPNLIKQELEVDAKEVVIKSSLSAVAAMNLGELYFYNYQFDYSAFWLKLALGVTNSSFDIGRVLRALVFQAQISIKQGQPDFAENIFIDCLSASKNYLTFNKIYCLQNYI